MLKKTISLILVTSFISLAFPVSNYAQEGPGTQIIQPYAHIIKWRYKEINGRWHKRQYDYTAQKWLGSWTPV